MSCKLTAFAQLVINFNLLHRICRQVVKHQFLVTSEEVLAVEHKFLHQPSVVIYVSVFAYFHTRQLTHKHIEHRTFCQYEGVGIVYYGVATVIKLHLCGRYGNLFQHFRLFTHQQRRQLTCKFALLQVVQLHGHFCCLVSQHAASYDICGILSGHGQRVVGCFARPIVIAPFRQCRCRSYYCAVRLHQLYCCPRQFVTCLVVVHLAFQC